MDVAPEVADTTIAEQHAVADIDAKLARAAERTRANYAAKGGKPGVASIVSRVMEMMPADTPRDEIVRVQPHEGDRPEISAAIRGSVVPPRFESATFESYEPATRGQSAAMKAAQFWAARAAKGECSMLALIGPQGTGKSHLLYAAANELLGDRHRCYARPWYRLADELRYGGESPFANAKTLEAHEVRALLWRQKIVLLDEVRPTAATAFDDTELAKFACWAYDAKLAVFITSNVSPLADVMGPPAASRFTQVIVDGPDRRQS